jgi:hypothetical protein
LFYSIARYEMHALFYLPQEVSLRDDTVLVEDEAAALHVALNRAEAWSRAAQRRAALLGESAVALEALASYEGSYVYGQQATTAALAAAAKVRRVALPCSRMRLAGLSSACRQNLIGRFKVAWDTGSMSNNHHVLLALSAICRPCS